MGGAAGPKCQQAVGGCPGSPCTPSSGRERQITEMRRPRGIQRSPKKDSLSRRISWENSYRAEPLREKGEGTSGCGEGSLRIRAPAASTLACLQARGFQGLAVRTEQVLAALGASGSWWGGGPGLGIT